MDIYRHGSALYKIEGNRYEHHLITGSGRVVHRFTRDFSDDQVKALRDGLEKLAAKKVDDNHDAIRAAVAEHQAELVAAK